ncbi:MAG: glycosyltransferase family 2 protein [Candidatus Omnitrophica bacterium]|nr:glycosyltransferase family 2 protein [Candidatus Omnitrophota bacterium]
MNSENSIDLSLVIACYKDGAYLESSLCEIEKVLEQTRYTYELILIDDCSPDGSARMVEEAAAKRENARCLLHQENVGRGGTVSEGMQMARGRYTGYLDIDLEVHARYIPSMLLALEEGCDGATAHRFYEIRWKPDIFFRHILSMTYRLLVRSLLGLPYIDTETGYKFFVRERIAPILKETHSPGWFWDTEIMAQCHYHGLRIQEIPALFLRRPERTTTVKPFRDSIIYFRELMRFRRRCKTNKKTSQPVS